MQGSMLRAIIWERWIPDQSDGDEDHQSFVAWMQRSACHVAHHMNASNVTEWAELQRYRQWKFAGVVARRDDQRWSTLLLDVGFLGK